jgi:hypothetical protein
MNDLERLQTDIEGHLLSSSSDPLQEDQCPIQHAAIARVRPRNAAEAAGIQTKLQKVMSGLEGRGGKKGISIVISMPEIGRMEPNVRALTGTVAVVIEVSENILINMGAEGTGKGCEEFALCVGDLLSHQAFAAWSPLRVRSIMPSPEAVLVQKVVYNVTLETDLNRPPMPKVAMPTRTFNTNHVRLATATAAAVIHYTLDGSFPGPGNEGSIVYDQVAGLTLPAGKHQLRYAAWLPGMVGSIPCEAELTVE